MASQKILTLRLDGGLTGKLYLPGPELLFQAEAELIDNIEQVARTITLGHPFDPATQMGALIDRGHLKRVLGYIDSGVSEGARVAFGMGWSGGLE